MGWNLGKGQGRLKLRYAAILLATAMGSNAMAQTAATPVTSPSPSTNSMVNLIQLLVKQGTITQANGDALIQQAEREAKDAQANLNQAAANAGLSAPPPGTIRVPYIPETVRKQIQDQIKTEVMSKAKDEGWAWPGEAAPEWTRNITISGDVRIRSESDFLTKNNVNDLINYAAINNTSGGFDLKNNINSIPFLNTTQDRINRLQLRARLGVSAKIGDAVTAAFKLATGDDNGPISTNQILGGGFAKRNIWLDQSYLKIAPRDWVDFTFGRFYNPFRSTDLLFDPDLNFDGVIANFDATPILPDGVKLAVRGGAFPLDFGSNNFPDTAGPESGKRKYPAKWMLSGQVEGGYDFSNGISLRLAAALHHFRNVQGQLSDPCYVNSSTQSLGTSDPAECSSDGTRAFFLTKGNTLFFIRNNQSSDGVGTINSNRQYLGLVYKFSILDLAASYSMPLNDKIKLSLDGDYVRNLAFRRRDECRYGLIAEPFTNLTENNGNSDACSAVNPAHVTSGNEGFMLRATVGHPRPTKWGEWSLSTSYRYLQTDAVLDSLTDSDFHLGGTNSKGYTIAGTVGLFNGVSLTGRWMSANEITGAPLAIDVLQIDLQAAF